MSAKRAAWLGLDLGTSSIKVLAIDENSAVIDSRSRTYPLLSPRSGWTEQNPRDWWGATASGIRDLLAHNPDLEIMGIGLSGQMHGLVPLDSDGDIVRPAILWNDNRTGSQVGRIVDLMGGLETLIAATGNNSLAGFTAGKVMWLSEEEPENHARTTSILNPKDYLRFRLTGARATDVSDASGTGYFDVRNRRWSSPVLSALGISEALLPEVFESSEVTSVVAAAAAAELGLPEGIPVVAGGGDSVLQTTAMGIISNGTLGITVGTAGIMAQAVEFCPDNPGGRVQVSCGNEAGRWHIMGVALTVGETLPWLARAFAPLTGSPDGLSRLVELAEASPPGARNLRYAPYLVGERCPHSDSEVRGAWMGLDIRHDVGDMVRSALEGAVFNLREIRDLFCDLGLQSSSVRVSGGATKHPPWRRLLADVLATEISSVTSGEHGAAFGAALLAGIGTGRWSNLDEALSGVRVVGADEPDLDIVAIYDEAFAEFRHLYSAISSLQAVDVTQPPLERK